MTEGAVNWSELEFILTAAGLVCTGITGACAWLWRRYASLQEGVEKLKIEMVQSQLGAAKEFVTITALERVEDRLASSIDRLGTRLEAAFHSVEQLASQFVQRNHA
jgi:hypothetical protein